MRGTIKFVDCSASRGTLFGFICLAALAAMALPCQADNLLDVSSVTRLDGAKVDPDRSSSIEMVYSVSGSVANTIAATKKLLAADGWQQYVSPSEEPDATGLSLKKGSQGLSVSFTMTAGQINKSSVYYTPDRLNIDLPFPADATDIVYDINRPYLSCVTGGTIDATLAFFAKELAASGWLPLSATDAAGHWPNANLDEKAANGVSAYYINGEQRPILLSLQPGADQKTKVEIKIPPFAEPQFLEAGADVSDLPTPKRAISSGGSSSDTQIALVAQVPAEVGTVLAFYRRELASRNFKEQSAGAVLNPDQALLTFSSPDGTVTLKLNHKYDLTAVILVLKVSEAALAARAKAEKDASDKFMKEAQDEANAAIAASDAKRAASAQASNGTTQTLGVLAGANTPVPIPATAQDVDYDGASGRLEFNTPSGFKSVVTFYRSTMKSMGWKPQPSVINAPTMVELDFSKDGKDVSFTIMQMGDTVNVTADGSALAGAKSKPAVADGDAQPDTGAAQASAQGTDQDLEAEDSGGLPVPKQHTLSIGAQTPFRHEVTASVPADLTSVLAFYRREFGKLNWTEDKKTAVVTADRAVVAYTSPNGPAVLKLDRKNGETSVSLAVRDPDAAAKARIMPKPGQAKLLFGNALPAEAAVSINNKTVKVSGGVGTKGPDGPSLDLAPGKYPYSIKMQSQSAQHDDVQIGADETWGLLIGPGGAMQMQMY
jgi:hypothetical protein